jgi:hypothetical protein
MNTQVGVYFFCCVLFAVCLSVSVQVCAFSLISPNIANIVPEVNVIDKLIRFLA